MFILNLRLEVRNVLLKIVDLFPPLRLESLACFSLGLPLLSLINIRHQRAFAVIKPPGLALILYNLLSNSNQGVVDSGVKDEEAGHLFVVRFLRDVLLSITKTEMSFHNVVVEVFSRYELVRLVILVGRLVA